MTDREGATGDSATSGRAKLTVVVSFFEMRREAERTLFTLSPEYQSHVDAADYDVIAIDNGSADPLRDEEVSRFGPNFRLMVEPPLSPSPAAAINRAVAGVSTPLVMCLVDGARMVSPGMLSGAIEALRAHPAAFVYTIGMHLGPSSQNRLVARGYTSDDEDELLASVDWERNGYRLFGISSFALSVTAAGFFSPMTESNCFAVGREAFLAQGGFDERFQAPGGGVVNLDLFKRFFEDPAVVPVCLLGEATFHQLHGGVATNVPLHEHPGQSFADEYEQIHGLPYTAPIERTPVYWGEIPDEARHLGPNSPPGRLSRRLSARIARAKIAWLALAERHRPGARRMRS